MRTCESHFDPDDILQPTIKDSGRGKKTRQPQLQEDAVPNYAPPKRKCVTCVHGPYISV